MVIIVVIINTFISIMLLYVAWQLWQLKQKIAFIGDRLTEYERCSYALLYKAPELIYSGQNSIQQLRKSNQSLRMQTQQLKQIISILLLGRQTWLRYFRRIDSIPKKSNSH
ncbi:hypothetical protein CLI64_08500 [Nostoc sp. CENA543]|uniref:hypothetical protein n=1 Tax=Nostoc sp. CENA543 TaxID=1869241 RepID=UPI000CA2E7A8|nr:hypothetical protein [Nostoc sp. CENA543]AUT00425.1 hypothetical protein CLI64_08500 [Nostoc sp. CENA543]